MACYLNHLGLVNALGRNHSEILRNLNSGAQPGLVACDWVKDFPCYIAEVSGQLPELSTELKARFHCRNNQLAQLAIEQVRPSIEQLKTQYGSDRIAVVIGTSTSGISEGEYALTTQENAGAVPAAYRYQQQEIGNVAEFIACELDLSGPQYTISTACSSSAHAFNSAQAMLENNMADVVIAGGVDSLCRLTVNGFASLESVSPNIANPFSQNRNGISIGEAAALFVVSKESSERAVELLSVGASSDAHHISAPEPEGSGAEKAIRQALQRAGLEPSDVSYINLHGTGTRLNDAMESKTIARIFGTTTPCSSSKAQIGHSLGAAAANELGLCWLSLQKENHNQSMPPHVWDEQSDSALAPIRLTKPGERFPTLRPRVIQSNSFAFGGNNASVLIRECAGY